MEPLISTRIKMRTRVNALLHLARRIVARDRLPPDVVALMQEVAAELTSLSKLVIEQEQATERQHYLLVSAARKRSASELDDPACALFRPNQQAKRQAAAAIGTRGSAGSAAGARRVGGAAGRKARAPRQRQVQPRKAAAAAVAVN